MACYLNLVMGPCCGSVACLGPLVLAGWSQFASFSLGAVILLRRPSGFGLLACIAMFVSAWFSLHSFALCWWGLLAFRCLCAFDLWEWLAAVLFPQLEILPVILALPRQTSGHAFSSVFSSPFC